jgi:hypothetical protein
MQYHDDRFGHLTIVGWPLVPEPQLPDHVWSRVLISARTETRTRSYASNEDGWRCERSANERSVEIVLYADAAGEVKDFDALRRFSGPQVVVHMRSSSADAIPQHPAETRDRPVTGTARLIWAGVEEPSTLTVDILPGPATEEMGSGWQTTEFPATVPMSDLRLPAEQVLVRLVATRLPRPTTLPLAWAGIGAYVAGRDLLLGRQSSA